MKKINCVLLMLFICLMNSSCKKEEPSVVSVTPSSVSFESNASSQTISITSNTSWNVSGSASWLKVGSTSGSSNSSITLTVEENKDFSERNCTLTISTEDNEASASVYVTQKPANLTFSVSSSTLSFESVGGSQTLKINTNANWTVSGADNWLKVSALSGKGDSELTLTAEENKTFVERNCTLTISTEDGGKASSSVTINQKAAEVTLSVNVYDLNFSENKGDVQYLTITSNSNWKITGKPEWLDLSSASGTGVSTINLTTNSFNESSSARNATLVVTANEVSVEVKVTQKAGLVADCDAEFGTVAVLCDGIAFDLELGSNVSSFGWGWMLKTEAGLLSDDKVIETLGSDVFRKYTPEKDRNRLFGDHGFTPNTEYIIYSLAYDKNGHRGNLIKKEIKTKKNTNAPYVSIEIDKVTANEWRWTTVKKGYCDKYYHVAWAGNDLINEVPLYNYSNAGIAWTLMQAIKDGLLELTVNGDTWSMERNAGDNYLQVVTWGVNAEGELSGLLNNYRGRVTSSSNIKDDRRQHDFVDMKKDVLLNNVKIYRIK